MKNFITIICTIAFINSTALPAGAATYYCDPVNGASSNPGTMAEPWAALFRETNRAYEAGDTILCMTGEHGRAVLKNPSDGELFFMPAPGEQPKLTFLGLSGSHITADGLTMTGEHEDSYEIVTNLVQIYGTGRHNTVRNCSLYSARDASNWTADDWDYLDGTHKVSGGMYLNGDSNLVENNIIMNIRTGISIYGGNYNVVRYNTINTFGEDGMFIQNPVTIEYNVIKNALTVTTMHTDGIQASAGTDHVIVRGNRIIHYEGEQGPFHDYMMGVSGHNGGHDDWLIENNLLVVTGWVGSQILGGANCRIINNTCLNTVGNTAEPPHLKIQSSGPGNVIRNNISPRIGADAQVTADHNISGVETVPDMCIDYAGGNYLIAPGCAAVDAGSADLAPAYDIRGAVRPTGSAVDIGCYEYTTSAVRPAGYLAPEAMVAECRISPMPVSARSTLSFTAYEPGTVMLSIYRTDGARVWDTSVAAGTGRHRLALTGLAAAPGLHFYMITRNGITVNQGSFIIQ